MAAASPKNRGDKMAENQPPKKHPYAFLFRFLAKTCALAAVVAAVLVWVLAFHRMTGNSMFPAVRDGDLCVFYKIGPCVLNDVVLYQDAGGLPHVGRIVATGGQTVSFPEEGGYLVDGYQPLEEIPYETYAAEGTQTLLALPEDAYYILNDFRSDVSDSRTSGPVQAAQIKGKLLVLLRRRGF